MTHVRLRFVKNAPKRIPVRVDAVHFAANATIELTIKVSAKSGIEMFGFSFAGSPIPMSHNQGTFNVVPGEKGLLEWVMVGSPGGTMKVTVNSGGAKVAEREKSIIVPPYAKGYDALEIVV